MYKINDDRAHNWSIHGNAKALVPLNIQVRCPNEECRESLAGMDLKWNRTGPFAWCSHACKICNSKFLVFVTDPREDKSKADNSQVFFHPAPSPDFEVTDGLEEVSPRFVEIYAQAVRSREQGLHELTGIGFRKALEFLVKDYAIFVKPEEEESIRSAWLTKVIEDYLPDVVKGDAERAAWLGNDEAHFTRDWTDQDIDDLELLMKIVIYRIGQDVNSKRYKKEMPRKNKL